MSQNFQRDREWGEDWARDVPHFRGRGTYEGQGKQERGPYAGVGPKDYQRSDERIFEDVCERLTYHGQIDARRIRVNVENGEITLEGNVPDRQTKRAAEFVADRVYGVKEVNNKLRIEERASARNRWTERESGLPGGGQGRVDEAGGSGVYPASGPMPQGNAPLQGEASWGQGERGAAGYEDSGSSELHIPPEQED